MPNSSTYYRAPSTPNLLLITSSDDGTVKLFDAVSGFYLRELVNLNHYRDDRQENINSAVVWRIAVEDDQLVCAAGSRNYLLDTQIIVIDYKDKLSNS